MTLRLAGHVELPPNRTEGGLDHADLHRRSGTAFIAHTCNDSLDVVDLRTRRYLRSLPGFKGVAGALVSQEREMVFTSNRAETSVSFFPFGEEASVRTVEIGGHPIGLAFDPGRGLLLAANIGRIGGRSGFSVSIVDVSNERMVADIEVPGRTRWAIFDRTSDRFYVNVRNPPQVVAVSPTDPFHLATAFPIPVAGPHGLDLDLAGQRLFCACDAGRLCTIDLRTGEVADVGALSGSPDVVVHHPHLHRLYVAVGEPGVIDVFDTRSWSRLESAPTEKGAGTLAFNPEANEIGAILSASHRVAVFRNE